jgi:hypothetical protein
MNFFAPEHLAQTINPWTWWLKANDNVNGLINITTYKTGDSHTEHKIVQEVAGYGMQLDAIEHVIMLLLTQFSEEALTEKEQHTIIHFKKMMEEITQKKEAIALEQLSNGGVEKLISNLQLLKEKNPTLYEKVAKTLKAAL